MKKKLIKEYGFKQNEQDRFCCFKVINGNLIEYNEGIEELYIFNNDIGAGDPMSGTDQYNIKGIIDEVLNITGVTLTPKPTKRQAIDKNTARSIGNNAEIVQNRRDIKKFNRNAEENRIATLATIDELKERIEVLEKDKTFRAIEGIKDLMDQAVLAQLAFPKGGVSSATVHGGETILGKNIANTTKAEPKSEPEKTEGVFEVGDKVVIVISKEHESTEWEELLKAMANKDVLTIESKGFGGFCVKIDGAKFVLKPSELQHAPKEAAKANSVSLEDYQNAYRCACDLLTLLDEKYYFGGVIPLESVEGVISQIDNVVAGLEKRKEAAKVLEFDTWAAIKTGDYRLNEGTKVLLIQELEISGGKLWWRCYTDKDRGSINILAEDLKAL
jgi:hypothetical protein